MTHRVLKEVRTLCAGGGARHATLNKLGFWNMETGLSSTYRLEIVTPGLGVVFGVVLPKQGARLHKAG